MIRIIVYAEDDTVKVVRDILLRYSMRFSWMEYDLARVNTPEAWEKWVNTDKLADMMICDVSSRDRISLLKRARKIHPQAMIVPVADLSVPAYMYVCPEIAPYSLIWKPPVHDQIGVVLSQAIRTFKPEKGEENGPADYFMLESKQNIHKIPYDRILFFEAREKKCFVRVEGKEYPFYDTLGHLEERLPETFIRCHKSYLVNVDRIETFDRKERQLILDGNLMLPVSRGCYPKVVEVLSRGE